MTKSFPIKNYISTASIASLCNWANKNQVFDVGFLVYRNEWMENLLKEFLLLLVKGKLSPNHMAFHFHISFTENPEIRI